MTSTTTAAPVSLFRTVEWSTAADAAGPILRRAVGSAVLHDHRVQVGFDAERNEYVLGLTAGS